MNLPVSAFQALGYTSACHMSFVNTGVGESATEFDISTPQNKKYVNRQLTSISLRYLCFNRELYCFSLMGKDLE